MERVGQHTLAPKNQPEDAPPLLFRLHRENEIRGGFRDTGKVGDETQTFELKWVFKRAR
jgi:hypothetical protein